MHRTWCSIHILFRWHQCHVIPFGHPLGTAQRSAVQSFHHLPRLQMESKLPFSFIKPNEDSQVPHGHKELALKKQTYPSRRAEPSWQTSPYLCCNSLPWAYLTGLEWMIKIYTPNPFLPHCPDKHVTSDLNWWQHALSQNLTTCPICPPPKPYLDISAFSDTSSTGIGIITGNHWWAWHLCPNRQTLNEKQNISWAEAIRFKLLVYTIATIGYPHSAFIIHSGNSGVIEGWSNGCHRHPSANEAFRHIHKFIHSWIPHDLNIHTIYVPSKSNPADGPSWGIPSPPHLLLLDIPILTPSVTWSRTFISDQELQCLHPLLPPVLTQPWACLSPSPANKAPWNSPLAVSPPHPLIQLVHFPLVVSLVRSPLEMATLFPTAFSLLPHPPSVLTA